MQPESQPDTRSPWYEAFTPQSSQQPAEVRWIVAEEEPAAESGARPETAEPDGSTEALFDCYNG